MSSTLAVQGIKTRNFLSTYAASATTLSAFSTAVMTERAASELYVAEGNSSPDELATVRASFDSTEAPALASLKAQAKLNEDVFGDVVTTVENQVGGIDAMRESIDNRTVTLLQVSDYYSTLIDAFTSSLFALAEADPVPEAATKLATSTLMYRGTEQWLEAETFGQAARMKKGLTQEEYTHFVEALGTARGDFEQLERQMTDAEKATLASAVTGTDSYKTIDEAMGVIANVGWRNPETYGENGFAKALQSIEAGTATSSTDEDGTSGDAVNLTSSQQYLATQLAKLPTDEDWITASNTVLGGFGTFGPTLTINASAIATESADQQTLLAIVAGVGLIGMGGLVLILTSRTSRALIGRLTLLRDETLQLAEVRLPDIIERLSRGDQVDAAVEVPPLHLGDDEIGQVGEAFNQAQRTAVEAAIGEAETRAGLRAVFLNIAHRTQVIAHRQLRVLDQAERTQEDPDHLAMLFELDHLATRSRRNAENLIILGGGQAGRQWRNPVALLQVIRSAIGESQEYAQVAIGNLPEVQLKGAAVADTAHLLAELVDNATSFSPPMARVEVRGNAVGRGVVVEIEDQGLGMEPEQMEQLNEMLRQPPNFQMMSLRDEPRLGMFVVAQLAARQGLSVTITPSPAYGGTRVVVLLPNTVLDGDASAARRTPAPLGNPAPAPRSPMGETGPQSVRGVKETTATAVAERETTTDVATSAIPMGVPRKETRPRETEVGDLYQFGGGNGTGEHKAAPDAPEMRRYDAPSPAAPAARPQPAPGRSTPAGGSTGPVPPVPQAQPGPAARSTEGPGPAAPGGAGIGSIPASSIFANPAAPAPSGPRQQATPSEGRPNLPKRQRQQHLSPRLRDTTTWDTPAASAAAEPTVDPDAARNRMSAFQRGTNRGRTDGDKNS